MQPADVIDSVRAAGVIAVLRTPDPRSALGAIDALVSGGIRGIEIICSTPGAAAVIREAGARHGDAIILGASTAGAMAIGAGGELCSAAALAAGSCDMLRGRAWEFAAVLSASRHRGALRKTLS